MKKEALAGKKVLITRSKEQSFSLFSKLVQLGAIAINCPIVSYNIVEKEIYNKSIVNNISSFDWIFFTSQNAVRYFFEILNRNCYDSRALAKTQVAVVGYKTKMELAKYNINADFIPKRFSFEDLIKELSERTNLQGKKILHPTQTVGTYNGMSQCVTPWHIYEANFIESLSKEIIKEIKQGIDIVTLFSSNTAKHFANLLEKHSIEPQLIAALRFAAIGDETAKTLKELFGRVDIIAEPYTEDGLIKSMENYFNLEVLHAISK